jgi:hypothetical protein
MDGPTQASEPLGGQASMPAAAGSSSLDDEFMDLIDYEAYSTGTPSGEQVSMPATASNPSIDEDFMSFIDHEAYGTDTAPTKSILGVGE